MRILVINSGSSSIKYKLFLMPDEKILADGIIEGIGEAGSKIKSHQQGLKSIFNDIKHIDAIGHRVVHGAEEFKEPTVINYAVIKKIKECCRLAPLHNPANLEGILACNKLLSGVVQIAVFDTAFFQTIPEYVYIYAIPYEFYKRFGIRRYGFHGTSHEYVMSEAALRLRKRPEKINLITCHLGNGCSIAAIKKAKAVEVSLGFTPLEGLVMGTRCGDIDPAIILYLQQEGGFSAEKIDNILNRESGLKGVSGISNNMRILLKSKSSRAKLAINIFMHRIRKYIGAYTAILGRVDAIIFTAGIGENQPKIRKKICDGLFSNLKYKPKILVIPTNEELLISRKTFKVMRNV